MKRFGDFVVCAFTIAVMGSTAILAVRAQDGVPSKKAAESAASKASGASAQIESWPALTKSGAMAMIEKYGEPDGVTDRALVWHDKAPWKKVAVFRDEAAHDFPIPHHDFIEHVIAYQVPEDKVESLSRFDHSLVADLTRGTLASHCDSEKANILALNLAHEIVSGKRTVASAKSFMRDTMTKEAAGKTSEYTEKLLFAADAEERAPEREKKAPEEENAPELKGPQP